MWINANVPVSKLILGLAAYGRSLLMSRPELHSPGDEFTGQPGPEGRYTQEKGVYAYYEVGKSKYTRFREKANQYSMKQKSCSAIIVIVVVIITIIINTIIIIFTIIITIMMTIFMLIKIDNGDNYDQSAVTAANAAFGDGVSGNNEYGN